jgi:FkbM family methyltransferase
MHLSYRLPNGAEIRVDSYSDWCTLGDLFMNGEYDHAIDYALRSRPSQKPFIFLDLGANVGFFTHRLLHRASIFETPANRFKGLLVEATPSLQPELQERLKIYRQQGAELKICIAAVGKRKGNAQMNAGRSHSRNYVTKDLNKGGWSIPFINLESEPFAQKEIDLIKCDIEGAEVFFLEEYPELISRCRVLVIECHPSHCIPTVARQRLETIGLNFGGILRDDPEGVTLWFTQSKALSIL